MKTVTIPKRARSINALLSQAASEDVVLRSSDGNCYLLQAIDDFAREVQAQRRSKRLMAILDELGKETEFIPLEQVEKELGLGPRKQGRTVSQVRHA